jgi:hypothetical protein
VLTPSNGLCHTPKCAAHLSPFVSRLVSDLALSNGLCHTPKCAAHLSPFVSRLVSDLAPSNGLCHTYIQACNAPVLCFWTRLEPVTECKRLMIYATQPPKRAPHLSFVSGLVSNRAGSDVSRASMHVLDPK